MARRLQDANQIRRFLAHCCDQVLKGKMEATVAGRLAYICNIMLRAIESEILPDLDQRLALLEHDKEY